MNTVPGLSQFHADERWRHARFNYETGLSELRDYRLLIHNDSLLRIMDISASAESPPPSGRTTACQMVLPYYGAFSYRVGRRDWIVDSNKILFVAADREYSDDHVAPALGHACLVLLPSLRLIDDLCGREVFDGNPAFVDGTRPAHPRMRLLAHRIRAASLSPQAALACDELSIEALREAVGMAHPRRGTMPSRLIDRAKELLHSAGYAPLSLEEIADAVGVNPVYLTQEFTRVEGLPLYRYHMRLRLDRALLELPRCENITELALSLGFSSHSHFSCAFKSVFGLTPSEYRSSTRPSHLGFNTANPRLAS